VFKDVVVQMVEIAERADTITPVSSWSSDAARDMDASRERVVEETPFIAGAVGAVRIAVSGE
jgi:hypothetical protein